MTRAKPRSRPTPRSGRRRAQAGASPRILHHLQAVLALTGRPVTGGRGGEPPPGRSQRRRRQHLALSQRLLDPLPEALRSSAQGGDRFWTALRWGGCGLALALLLAR